MFLFFGFSVDVEIVFGETGLVELLGEGEELGGEGVLGFVVGEDLLEGEVEEVVGGLLLVDGDELIKVEGFTDFEDVGGEYFFEAEFETA